MSAKEIVTLECDIADGRPAEEHGEARTIRFSLGGEVYEAEVCADAELDIAVAFEPFILAARPAGARRKAAGTASRKSRPAAGRRRNAEIRAWALAKGLTAAGRGRFSVEVVRLYEAEHQGAGR